MGCTETWTGSSRYSEKTVPSISWSTAALKGPFNSSSPCRMVAISSTACVGICTTNLRFIFSPLNSKKLFDFVHPLHNLLGYVLPGWNRELNHRQNLVNILCQARNNLTRFLSLVSHFHNCDYKGNHEKGKH